MDGLSIIVPAWKTEKFINEFLETLYNQTWFEKNNNWEVLIGIDNCENTLNAVNPLHNTEIFWFKEHYGPYIIRNTLAYLSKYDKLLFLDSDDICYPQLIEILLNYKSDIIKFYLYYEERKTDNISYGQFLVKKSVFKEFGGFFPWICSADSEFLNRTKHNGIKIKTVNKVLYFKRAHENALTIREETKHGSKIRKEFKLMMKENLKNNIKYIEPVFGKYRKIEK